MQKRTYCKTPSCRRWANLNDEEHCPICASTDHQEGENCKCGICTVVLPENEPKAIGCDLCEQWFHSKCVGCPDELINLMNSINESTTKHSANLLGNLIWVCPSCNNNDTPKTVKLSKNLCSVPKVTDKGCSATESIPICTDYRYGKCQKGDKCDYAHPPKCLDYCRYGREGCSGGYRKCKLLHPVLCKSSLRYNQCFDQSCTLAHLKGTNRKKGALPQRNHENPSSGFRHSQPRGKSGYSPYDSRKLGFLNYNQSSRLQNYSGYSNNNYRTNQNTDSYCFNQNDFPSFATNIEHHQDNPLPAIQNPPAVSMPEQSIFLEMLQQMRSMKEAQSSFQQELLALKSLIPPPTHQTQRHQTSCYYPNQQQPGMTQCNPSQATAT